MELIMVLNNRRIAAEKITEELAAGRVGRQSISRIKQDARRLALAEKPSATQEFLDHFANTEWADACQQRGIPVACVRVDSNCPKPCPTCPCDFPEAPPELVEQLKVLRPGGAGDHVTIDRHKFIIVSCDMSARSQRITLAPAACLY